MSKTYQVQGPDGKVHEFEGPDGATPAQVMAAAQAQFGGGPAQQDQAQPSNQGTGMMGSVLAAIHGFEDTATFGQGDKLAAGLATALQPAAHAIGLRSEASKSYSDNLADIRQQYSQLAGEHPVGAIAGDVGGLFAGGGVLKAGMRAAKGVPYLGKIASTAETLLAPRAGAPVRNFVKNAAVAGGLSGAMSAAEGDDSGQVAINTVAGGLGGAVVGEVANAGVRLFQGASAKGMLALAKAFKMEPTELENLFNRYTTETGGRTPTMAELVNLKTEGELGQMAQRNSTIGAAATDAAKLRTPSIANQSADELAQKFPQNERGLTDLRNSRMDDAMGRNQSVSTNPVYARKVAINADDLDMLMQRDVAGALRANSPVRKKIAMAAQDLQAQPDGVSERLTVDDFDNIRQSIRSKVADYANPNHPRHNSQAAKELGNVLDGVTGVAEREVPEYADALTRFKQDSDYIAGFRHGNAGKPLGALKPGLEESAVMSANGQAGYQHGNTLYNGQAKLRGIAPGAPQPEEQFGVHHASQLAAGAATAPNAWSISHVMRSIPGLHMPESVQQTVAKQLFSRDPAVVKQGIANLRRGRALDKDISALAQRVGGIAGLNIQNALQGQ